MDTPTRICPHCGTPTIGVQKFCGACGQPFSAEDAPAIPTTAPPASLATVPPRPRTEVASIGRAPILLFGIGGATLLVGAAAVFFFVLMGRNTAAAEVDRVVDTAAQNFRANPSVIVAKDIRPMPQSGPDADNDWVSAADEAKFGTDPALVDTDEDTLTDFEEIFIFRTNPLVADADTDGDMRPDAVEALFGTDPQVAEADRDFDGLPDTLERQKGSDAGILDTDGDTLSDLLELYLTETNPDAADPLTTNGFPEPLVPWLPQELQNSRACQVQADMSIDELVIVDPEEADSVSDIILGDEAYMFYGMWINAEDFSDLDFDFTDNRATGEWSADTLLEGDTISRFDSVLPLTATCGDTITWVIALYESDSPWGGMRSFGLWRDERQIVFDRIPMGWRYGETAMIAEGTGGDSGSYRYDVYYSALLELNP